MLWQTPTAVACKSDPQCLRALLEAKADIKLIPDAIARACTAPQAVRREMVGLLLAAKCEVDKDAGPLTAAVRSRDDYIVRQLLGASAVAVVNKRNQQGRVSW